MNVQYRHCCTELQKLLQTRVHVLVPICFVYVSIPMCLVRVPAMASKILIVVRRQPLNSQQKGERVSKTYSFQPILGVEWTFDFAMKIGKYFFSESLDWVKLLFLA